MLSLGMALRAFHSDLSLMAQGECKAFRERTYLELLCIVVALNVQLLKTAVKISTLF